MKRTNTDANTEQHFQALHDFLATTPGLKISKQDTSNVEICQLADKKTIQFEMQAVSDVLTRNDIEGNPFIQINFKSGKKILLTGTLIGFKPAPVVGLDLAKLPKVVTTPDLISVFEAIEEAVALKVDDEELETLKKVFSSILSGGELIGFDLAQERQWLWCLLHTKASA